VQVAKNARDRAAALQKLAETRRETGVGSAADVSRSRLNTLRREEELAQRDGDLAVSLAVLRAALVMEEDAAVSLRDSLEAMTAYSAAGDRGAGRYPELDSGRAQLRAAEADVDVARSGYIPNVELFGAGSYGSGAIGGTTGGLGLAPYMAPLSDRFQPWAGFVQAGGVVTWRAFDLFVVRDRVRQAEQAASGAKANLDEIAREVGERRAEARAKEDRAKKRALVLSNGLTVAAESVQLAKGRYETGNTILTEVLDAELDSIAIQARQVEAAYDLAVAHIERLRAEGMSL
jgi:outer membrane protein TolC